MLLSPITHYNQYRVQRGRLYRFENRIHGEDIIYLLLFTKIQFAMNVTSIYDRLIFWKANYCQLEYSIYHVQLILILHKLIEMSGHTTLINEERRLMISFIFHSWTKSKLSEMHFNIFQKQGGISK